MANKKIPKDVYFGLKIAKLEEKYLEGKSNTRQNRIDAYNYATNRLASSRTLGLKKRK